MTDATLPAHRFVEGDFRVGRVIGRTSAIFSRNFLKFFVVTAIATLPMALLSGPADDDVTARSLLWTVFGLFLVIGLSTLSQAIVLYGALQDMRRRPIDRSESLQVGLLRCLACRRRATGRVRQHGEKRQLTKGNRRKIFGLMLLRHLLRWSHITTYGSPRKRRQQGFISAKSRVDP